MGSRTQHREALRALIAKKAGAEVAEAKLAEKHRRTVSGLRIACFAVVGAVASKYLDAPWYVTLSIGVGGGFWAASIWDNEFMVAALSDLAPAVARIIKALKGGDP